MSRTAGPSGCKRPGGARLAPCGLGDARRLGGRRHGDPARLAAHARLETDPGSGRVELYDLAHDPAEREDRFGPTPGGRALVGRPAAWEAAQPAPPPAVGRNPALGERLRALGYVNR